jgi:hypothetical protein
VYKKGVEMDALHQPTTKEKILGEAKSKVERFLSEDLS